MPPALIPIHQQFTDAIRKSMASLYDGTWELDEWERDFTALITRYHTAAFLKGNRTFELPDWAKNLLRDTVDNQVQYLRGFRQAMQLAGDPGELAAKWLARARMYANATKTTYWEGEVARIAGRPLPLPAMPAQGTQCLSNCLCGWRIEVLDRKAGDFDAYWERRADDSCQTCVQRELEWNGPGGDGSRPVRIRGWVLQPLGVRVKHLQGKHDQGTHGGGKPSEVDLEKAWDEVAAWEPNRRTIARAAIDDMMSRRGGYSGTIERDGGGKVTAVLSYKPMGDATLVNNFATAGSGGKDVLVRLRAKVGTPLEFHATASARDYYEHIGLDLVPGTANVYRMKHLSGQHDQSSHGGRSATAISELSHRPPSERAWQGQQQVGGGLTKLQTGAIGEAVATQVLSAKFGAEFKTMNEGLNNAPVDVAGDHRAVEVKTGLASNGSTAQHWRATIGQPGKAETAVLQRMTSEEKRAHNARKGEAILARKEKALAAMSESVGAPVKPLTTCIILSGDGRKADVFLVPGFHLRLPWNRYATDEFYQGTVDVDTSRFKAVGDWTAALDAVVLKHLQGKHDQASHGRGGTGAPARRVDEEDVDVLVRGSDEWDFMHITMPENLIGIAEHGLIPQDKPAGQNWSADHSQYATYFHGSSIGAASNINNVREDIGTRLPMVIALFPTGNREQARDLASRILPDEDVSRDVNYPVRDLLRDGSSVAIIGGAKPSQLLFVVDTNYEDFDYSAFMRAANKSGAQVMTFDDYAEEYDESFKHLSGQHDQSTHGARSGVISQAEVAEFVKDSKIKEPIYTGGSANRRSRLEKGDFDPERAGANVWQGSAIYGTTARSVAENYGAPITMAANIKRPFEGTTEQVQAKVNELKGTLTPPKIKLPDGRELDVRAWVSPGQEMAALRRAWMDEGYDGIIMDSGNQIVVAVFDPANLRVVED